MLRYIWPSLIVTALLGCAFQAQSDGMHRIYELPSADYPEECLAKRIEGTVILRFHVTSSGKIKDIVVAKTVKACPAFTQAALNAVRHAKVYPLPPGQRILTQTIEIPITFTVSSNQF